MSTAPPPVLVVDALVKHYPILGGLFGREVWLELGKQGVWILPETVAHDPRLAAALKAGP